MSKILVVEDDKFLVKAYQAKLTNEGYNIDIASDGQEAIKKLEVNTYNLILLDLMLPKIDGFTVLEKLRSSNWPNKNNPVIILTNLSQKSDEDKAKKLGANDFIIKTDVTPNQVIDKIKQYIK